MRIAFIRSILTIRKQFHAKMKFSNYVFAICMGISAVAQSRPFDYMALECQNGDFND